MNRMTGIVRVVSTVALCAVAVLSSGCATPMALTSDTPLPSLGPDKGLVLLVIETTKEKMGSKSIRPIVQRFTVGSMRGEKAQLYSVPLNAVSFKDDAVTHLISLSLPAGEYEIERIGGSGLRDKWIENTTWNALNRQYQGQFDSPLNGSFIVTAGKVVYAGHIKAHMRRRTSDSEPLAASVIPLLDQRIAGFYPTTFDITVTDSFDDDVGRFVAKFPSLQRDSIGKALCARNSQKKE
jgi:hypothetical protein